MPHFLNPFISCGASGCFQSLTIVKNVAINMGVHVTLLYPGTPGVSPTVVLLDFMVVIVSVFLRSQDTAFHSGHIDLPSQQQCGSVNSPTSLPEFVVVVVWVIDDSHCD
jgi:hypothetical protein